MKPDLKRITSHFDIEWEYLDAAPFGSGHIHDTYRISTKEQHSPGYILQRINTGIFRDVATLQQNIETVTAHIRDKLKAIPGSDSLRQCMTVIRSRDGATWYTDEEGNNWRMFIYIARHRSYDSIDNEEKAFEGGRAIGTFTAMLADLPGDAVAETIRDFHNIDKRIADFRSSVTADRAGRAREVRREIDEIESRAESMRVIRRLGAEGQIPLRITHNDTKFNNVLLDENDRALCVIDLDTVMPGYVHYDFGDAIRTAANTGAEDAANTESVALSLSLYRAWSHGFLTETKHILTPTELDWLHFAPGLITFEQSLRFLADHIDGDVYYRVHFQNHNLQRAKAQLKLLQSMEANAEEMKSTIKALL
ncbi:MAG: aminoglycoside phosphotransferase family protein [Bacteroidales bacterium]